MANLSKNPTALTRVRRAAGLSRTQLAEKVGISDRTIERWEQRRSDIGEAAAGSVLAIATTLGCNVEDILDTLPTIDVSKKSSRQQIGTQKKPMDTNLKKCRVAAGLSLNGLAAISGVQRQAIFSYESKRNNINLASTRAVLALSMALGVSFGEILEPQ